MNTFITANLVCGDELTNIVRQLKSIPLNTRILQRGEREQRNGKYLANYYPDAVKRIIKKRTLFCHHYDGIYCYSYPIKIVN